MYGDMICQFDIIKIITFCQNARSVTFRINLLPANCFYVHVRKISMRTIDALTSILVMYEQVWGGYEEMNKRIIYFYKIA